MTDPLVEAIATDVLLELEAEGYHVVPTSRAARLTMNREGIRRLVAEELNLPTSPYRFAANEAEFRAAVAEIGFPCVIKPVMSSSGKGQSVARSDADLPHCWKYSQEGGRAGGGKVIVEGFVQFDYESVIFSEVSPRPHDTGMVTLLSQDLSEFALHVRAILGLPIPNITQHGPCASAVILPEGHNTAVAFGNLSQALAAPDSLFWNYVGTSQS